MGGELGDEKPLYFLVDFVVNLKTSLKRNVIKKKKKELLFSRQVMSDFFEPVDCSPPGSSVHGIIQARILEWVAISFFKEKKRERDEEMLGRSGV